ncbi:MAG: non-canonical purine NTP pyrophosphatase [Candidatus Doudnabacteria bacterium]|nr:non-canonical purine NTP pyrophosphatase [Candidatus Doudnabacteria bacterium]
MLKFITGNKGKFGEAVLMLAPIPVSQLDIDVDEIQTLDHKKVIAHKLAHALGHQTGDFFIEDTCVYFEGLKNKLPGTYARSFWEVMGAKGTHDFIKRLSSDRAEMHSVIGYAENKNKIHFFSSRIKGKIVKPKGTYGFGYDRIFRPDKTGKTLSELKEQGKFEYSPRCGAMNKLKKYLLANIA